MKVLSLCDGMSCGRIALERAGIEVEKYFASEIKEVGIKVTKYNYPDTIHIGDVNKVSYKDGILHTENGDFATDIDMVIFGSPCQTFSQNMKKELRVGLENKEKSGLFYECHRVMKEVNPKYFLMENVGSMKKEDVKTISEFMGVKPLRINSSLVAPALRDRYYWTNISYPPFDFIEDKEIELNDILSNGWSDKKKAKCLLVSDSRPSTTPIRMVNRYLGLGFTTLIFKDENHYNECVAEWNRLRGDEKKIPVEIMKQYTGHVFDGVRYLNQTELEDCQTVPNGYTKCLTRNEAADVLGDGWTIDVIARIFKCI